MSYYETVGVLVRLGMDMDQAEAVVARAVANGRKDGTDGVPGAALDHSAGLALVTSYHPEWPDGKRLSVTVTAVTR